MVEVELKMANRTIEEQSMLINQLEKDLSSVNQQFSKFRTEGDGAPNPPPPFSVILLLNKIYSSLTIKLFGY